jgi:hypothetical protein
VVIIDAIKGLRVGQCAYHLAREKPTTVVELYEVIQKYCKSDNDYRKRIKKTTSGLNSSKTTTFTLQDQTTMNEDHLHHTIK